MPDTPDPAPQDTPDPAAAAVADPPADPAAEPQTPQAAPQFSWKNKLPTELANSPTMQKYADTKDGLAGAAKSYLELTRLLGHEKVPVPKGPNDEAGLKAFRTAFRVPDGPEGYGLPDAENSPEGLAMKKEDFAAAVHKQNLSPDQAKGLWQAYTETVKGAYSSAVQKQQQEVQNAVNQLRQEWGDAYNENVELGQMVINKFAADKGMNDFVTATLSKDPQGIKFLATLGKQFAENKVGDFKYQKYGLTPQEAEAELSAIRGDNSHPYNNDKASQHERVAAIDYVNGLIAIVQKSRGNA